VRRFAFGWLSRLATRSVPGQVVDDSSKRSLLLITHEAGRTGAPILAQNIAAHLSKNYNIVFLSLEDGELIEAFSEVSVAVHSIRRGLPEILRMPFAILGLNACHRFHVVIVNSMVTFRPTKALKISGLPVVLLVHEFAIYERTLTSIRQLFDASRLIVFSSKLTLEHSRVRIGFNPGANVAVLPQGKSDIPGTSTVSDETLSNLKASIRSPCREDAIVVLGAGSLQYRKGVDIFIAAAVAVVAKASQVAWHFVWIGGTVDAKYALYVKDQIERSGIAGSVTMLPPTAAIEAAYRMADVFLMCSRLDPLPNVSLDAMAAGLPVLCFDRATGLAELLRDAGQGEACVIPYLDQNALADRLVSLSSSPVRRAEIGRALANYANQRLRMETYVSRLDELIENTLSAYGMP
jgi:glycosyltransferase involved in cell wall biosynthesis